MDCPSPTTMSAPISPGGVTAPSDSASVKTAISSAPCFWQASAIRVRSRRLPKTSGV